MELGRVQAQSGEDWEPWYTEVEEESGNCVSEENRVMVSDNYVIIVVVLDIMQENAHPKAKGKEEKEVTKAKAKAKAKTRKESKVKERAK